jgi:uncharacterized protein
MEYRELGMTGLTASRLGFGAMRLPMTRIGDADYVDLDRATETLLTAFRMGVNYVDGGLLYGNNQSEFVIGRALRAYERAEDIVLTTKATKFQMKQPGDLRRMMEHQLQRMERDWVHFYLLHGIGWDNFHEIDAKTGWFKDLIAARDEGLAKHIGFSFHDEPAAMIDLIQEGWAELVTCQYNYLDRRNEPAIRVAHEKGVAVVVMGPVGGGRLAVKPSGVDDVVGDASAAELALRFVASNPGVDVVLSGMGSEEMVAQNVAAIERGALDEADRAALTDLMTRQRQLAELYCTGCEYCMPCSAGVNISRCFELYNYLTVYGLVDYARTQYGLLVGRGQDASVCIECGECLDRCPQRIPIPDQLREVAGTFA